MTTRRISDAIWTPLARLLVPPLNAAAEYRDRHRAPVTHAPAT